MEAGHGARRDGPCRSARGGRSAWERVAGVELRLQGGDALGERVGDADAELLKSMLPRLLENDASSARPEGSMEVLHVVWWQHPSKTGVCSSAKVHGSLSVERDGQVAVLAIDGLTAEVIPGF